MACPPIITGSEFLVRTIAHIDCQAQIIGSYGYVALGQPGSVAATLVTGLLTLFVAFFGIRLLFGPPPGARDVVFDALKIGIVLTLAFSWPAFRTVIYDVTLQGPGEIASVLQSGTSASDGAGFAQKLQQTDNSIVALTEWGTGRNTGQFLDEGRPGASFAGTALQDDAALGYARLAYLAGVIGSFALLRIAAGLLLALAPLAAGMLLFTQTRGLFAGWLKGLVLALLGSVGAVIVLGVELAILGPWLADALLVRQAGYATPSAPIELLAITLAFAVVQLLMIWLLARVAFYHGWPEIPAMLQFDIPSSTGERVRVLEPTELAAAPSRAERTSSSIVRLIEREQRQSSERTAIRSIEQGGVISTPPGSGMSAESRLGANYRRNANHHSRARSKRDRMP